MRKHFAVQSEWDHSLKLNTKFTFYELQKINQIPNGPSTRTSHIALSTHSTQSAKLIHIVDAEKEIVCNLF